MSAEPKIHSGITDSLPWDHPKAMDSLWCEICKCAVHAGNNECMDTWVETGEGPLCLPCFYKLFPQDEEKYALPDETPLEQRLFGVEEPVSFLSEADNMFLFLMRLVRRLETGNSNVQESEKLVCIEARKRLLAYYKFREKEFGEVKSLGPDWEAGSV